MERRPTCPDCGGMEIFEYAPLDRVRYRIATVTNGTPIVPDDLGDPEYYSNRSAHNGARFGCRSCGQGFEDFRHMESAE